MGRAAVTQEFTDHLARMVTFIELYMRKHDRAPSVEEIRVAMGMASKDHVHRDLGKVEDLGFVRRTRGIARGLELLRCADGQPFGDVITIPLLGRIAAGLPIPAPHEGEEPEDRLELTRDIVRDTRGVYALRVKGTSMIDALINDGDIVILRHAETADNGEMVAAWIKSRQETTLKRFFDEGDQIRLQPENQAMAPIYVAPEDVEIQGKVIAVIRHV